MDARKLQVLLRLIDMVEKVMISTPDADGDAISVPMPRQPKQPESPFIDREFEASITEAMNRLIIPESPNVPIAPFDPPDISEQEMHE